MIRPLRESKLQSLEGFSTFSDLADLFVVTFMLSPSCYIKRVSKQNKRQRQQQQVVDFVWLVVVIIQLSRGSQLED